MHASLLGSVSFFGGLVSWNCQLSDVSRRTAMSTPPVPPRVAQLPDTPPEWHTDMHQSQPRQRVVSSMMHHSHDYHAMIRYWAALLDVNDLGRILELCSPSEVSRLSPAAPARPILQLRGESDTDFQAWVQRVGEVPQLLRRKQTPQPDEAHLTEGTSCSSPAAPDTRPHTGTRPHDAEDGSGATMAKRLAQKTEVTEPVGGATAAASPVGTTSGRSAPQVCYLASGAEEPRESSASSRSNTRTEKMILLGELTCRTIMDLPPQFTELNAVAPDTGSHPGKGPLCVGHTLISFRRLRQCHAWVTTWVRVRVQNTCSVFGQCEEHC